MELRYFRYFTAVAEELSFTRAAERLHIASSPLSRHIARLEEELGARLFERTTRSVALTEAGQYLLQQVSELSIALERVATNTHRIHRGDGGSITVGYSGSAAYDVVPRIVRRFAGRHPHVTVDITGELGSRRQVEAIEDGSLMVGFVRDVELPAGIESARIHSEDLVLLLPDDHPLTRAAEVSVEDLRGESIISFHRTTKIAQAVEGTCRREGFEPRVVARAKESFALACMVAAGLGVALSPSSAQHLRLEGLAVRELPRGSTERVHLNMVWAQDQTSAQFESFKAVALEVGSTLRD